MTSKEEKQICKKLDSDLSEAIRQAREFLKQAREAKASLKQNGLRFSRKCELDFLPDQVRLHWALVSLDEHRTEIEAARKRATNYLPDPGFFK